jgi:hypothetical protein
MAGLRLKAGLRLNNGGIEAKTTSSSKAGELRAGEPWFCPGTCPLPLSLSSAPDAASNFKQKVDDTVHIATAKQMKADGHTGRDIAKYLCS